MARLRPNVRLMLPDIKRRSSSFAATFLNGTVFAVSSWIFLVIRAEEGVCESSPTSTILGGGPAWHRGLEGR